MIKEFFIGFKGGQKEFAETIAAIINSILLTLVYIFGVGLTSIIGKIFGKRFLELKLQKGSYWEDLNLEKKKMGDYFRQF